MYRTINIVKIRSNKFLCKAMSSTSLSSASSKTGKRVSLSTIESSVTRLLVSTKHLLESLTQWARKEADDKFVSDAYVKLGNDFRAATKAFAHAGVDISDIGDVPHALRVILEAALGEEPTQEHLDKFLPNIRSIIVNLLQNLKSKQIKAKSLAMEKKSKGESGASPSSAGGSHARHETPAREQPPHQKSYSNDALLQLQKGNSLQRRASKRFSAYQYAKLTNSAASAELPAISVPDYQPERNTNDLPAPKSADSSVSSVSKSGDINVFLRIGNKTKKASVTLPVTFASLRLLFVEKFAYSPGSSSFPEIYIQDPKSGVSYELEEHLLSVDVKEGSVLNLNEPDSQKASVKQLEDDMQKFISRFDALSAKLSSDVKDTILSIPPPVAPPMATPAPPPASSNVAEKSDSTSKDDLMGFVKEFQFVMKELKGIRQVQNLLKDSMKSNISDIFQQVKSLREAGLDVSKSSNRAYMDNCGTKLSETSDTLLTKVDDLQDVMEALRKDVAHRGVRVSEKQLKHTYKEIQDARTALRQMTNYIKKEKVQWKKIWESELDKVCEEQQFFNLQDDLTLDLEEDLAKIEETYGLIEQCSLEQVKQSNAKRNKVVARLHIPEPGESLHSIKDEVMNEVASLVPDHDRRVKAISKAEKMRQKEREMMMMNQFQEELGEFVEDNKFKNSGGIDEIERIRRERDAENMKSSFGII
ncbi:Piso0_003424 [Millerozyma farinosa CBS 7064]|uniref:Piso0_003424 protein n=1 Tax=Pichia sorbitophila (strain ATCC MYA-4447 / BCRC 22081 / CBS 7064 / NBRC 10061 / NRRL Y-12695) TaxID=559304 RepID=G8YI24_PICSO|nr:Piso0_003424 [Millerozyma farinosa CBS 7064]CCE81076.1 Piso0_003424 [Millerozyma farinosa CBS 7064]